MPPSLLAALPLAALVAAPLAMGGAPLDAGRLIGIAAGAWLVALAGERVSLLLPRALLERSRTSWSATIGIAVCALVVAGTCHAAGTSATTGFAVFASITVALVVATRHRVAGASGEDALDALRLAAIVGVVLYWARRQLAPLPEPGRDGTIAVWTDYVLHAVEIAQYANPGGMGVGAMLLAGEAPIFYHRAHYAIPASLAQGLDLIPLQAATASLLPIGLCLAVLGAALFADRLAGDRRAAGWLAAACVVALPDAAQYGLRNGFFGAHWLLFTAPGTGWAAGLCLASAACAVAAMRESSPRAWGAAFALAAASFFFRAHVFLVWMPALALVACVHVARGSRPGRTTIRAGVALAVVALVAAAVVPGTRAAWLSFAAVDEYLPAVHRTMAPTAYEGVYDAIAAALPLPATLALATLAVLPAALGALPILPAVAAMRVRHRHPPAPAGDVLPWAMALVAVLLTLVAPTPAHGDVSEYAHRGLPLLYLAFACATAATLVRLLPAGSGRAPTSAVPWIAVTALAATMWTNAGRDPAAPIPTGLQSFYPLPLDGALTGAAAFVRAHGAPGERIVALPAEPTAMLNDAASTLVALTGAPAWIGRAGIQLATAPEPRASTIRARLADLERLPAEADAGRVATWSRDRGIGWLVVRAPAAPAWDAGGRGATFRSGDVAVYRVAGGAR